MSVTLPAPGQPDVLYIVDISGYIFRAYYATPPLSNSKGEATHAVLGTVNMLLRFIHTRRPSMLAVAMDSKGSSFRKEIDARYKAHRPSAPEDLSLQMKRAEEIVCAYGIPIFQKEGFEADDLIASLVKHAVHSALLVVVISSDKDLMQLVRDQDEKVLLWDSMRDKVYGPEEVREKWLVSPSQLGDLLALTGDSSDNIPGVKGVGLKTASELIKNFGSLQNIYEKIDEVKKPKLKNLLLEGKEDAFLSARLVRLVEDIPLDWDSERLKVREVNVDRLRELYKELEFHRLYDALQKEETKKLPSEHVEFFTPHEKRGEPAPAAATSMDVQKKGELRGEEGVLDEQKQHREEDKEFLREAFSQPKNVEVVLGEAELKKLSERMLLEDCFGMHLFYEGDRMDAKVIGFAFAVSLDEVYYVPLGHHYLGAPKQLEQTGFVRHMKPVFEKKNGQISCDGLKAASLILARMGIRLASWTCDPGVADYLIEPDRQHDISHIASREWNVALLETSVEKRTRKQGQSEAGQEIEASSMSCGRLAAFSLAAKAPLFSSLKKQGLESLFTDIEMPLVRVLSQLEENGVLVDVARLLEVNKRLEVQLLELEAEAYRSAGREFSIRSRDQLEAILFDELKLPALKKTPKGGRSTDAEVLSELALSHGLPELILQYRELDKLKNTYLDALPRYVHPETGRIHSKFEQTVAATGRLSSVDPNLQNIPVRTPIGREIRKAFIAEEGHVLVSADYSQIELRVLAHLSQDPLLIEAFQNDEDVHVHTASLIFNCPKENVTQEMRRQAKTINFGIIYGMGDWALAKQLRVTRKEAHGFIDAYFERYRGVKEFLDKLVAGSEGEGDSAVYTITGRRRILPALKAKNKVLRAEAIRVAKNTPIQGTAADILKLAMISLEKPVVKGAKMVLTVHDELVFEVPASAKDEASSLIQNKMSQALELSVPLVVDLKIGTSWGDAS